MEGRSVRITVKDRVLVHLLDYPDYEERVLVPSELTQRGIADVVGARRSHVSMTLSSLVEDGYVLEQGKRVEGAPRRLKAYFLTPRGYAQAVKLKDAYLRQTVTLWSRGQAESVALGDLRDRLGQDFYLVDLLASIREDGSLDLDALVGKEEAAERFYAAPLLNVGCPRCAARFMVQKPEQEGAGYTVCPACATQFELTPSRWLVATPPSQTGPAPAILGILLGLGFLFSAFAVRGAIGGLWLMALFVFTLLGAAGAMTMGDAEGRHRRLTLVLSVFLALLGATLFKVLLTGPFLTTTLVDIALVAGPVFGVILFGTPLPLALRSEIAIAAGVFLGLLGFFVAVVPGVFLWGQDFAMFLLILGVASVLVGYELHRPEEAVWTTLCLSVGAFMVAFVVVWAVRNLETLSPTYAVAAALWATLGVHVARTRFARADLRDAIVLRFRAALPYALGVAFLLVAVVLIARGMWTESALELLVGVPLLWYGWQQRPEGNGALVLFAYVTVLQVFTAAAYLLAEARL